MVFFDIESNEKITLEQLKTEYIFRVNNEKGFSTEYTSFHDYIVNSLTSHNGTLEILK